MTRIHAIKTLGTGHIAAVVAKSISPSVRLETLANGAWMGGCPEMQTAYLTVKNLFDLGDNFADCK